MQKSGSHITDLDSSSFGRRHKQTIWFDCLIVVGVIENSTDTLFAVAGRITRQRSSQVAETTAKATPAQYLMAADKKHLLD
jgi:hypothetical protein